MLWKKTETPLYAVIRMEDISEDALRQKGVKYITNKQAGVYYIEVPDVEKFKNYTYRTLGTPLTVVVDAVAIGVVAFVSRGQIPLDSVLDDAVAYVRNKSRLNGNIKKLDKLTSQPAAETAAIGLLVKEFYVTPEQIADLRKQSLKYGEITAILTLSEGMTGACTEDNINIVVELRKTTPEWPDVAAILGADLEASWTKIYSIRTNVNEIMKNSGGATAGEASGVSDD